MIRFAVRSGLRSGEVRGLRWQDVDIPGRQYQLAQQVSFSGEITTKLKTSNSGRPTPLLTVGRDELIDWREESGRRSGLIFPSAYGQPIHRDRLRWVLESASRRPGSSPSRRTS